MEHEMICYKLDSLLDDSVCDFQKNCEALSIEEAGEAADIIKDLAQAKKYVMESKYYDTVIKAMEEGGDTYGYTPYRPMNSMKPMVDQMPYVNEYLNDPDGYIRRMGYTPSSTMNHMNQGQSRYGQAFTGYRNAKRHYNETKDHADKEEMSQMTRDHVLDTMATMSEMWADADPTLRTEMREKLQKLLNEMK